MRSGIALGRVFGVEVRVHWSWIPVLAFVVVLFGSNLSIDPNAWPVPAAWATAIAMALFVLASVTAHELAHALAARRNGLAADSVVVQLLGGPFVSSVRAVSPGQELRLALAGPALSLIVGTLAVAGGLTMSQAGFDRLEAPIGQQAVELLAACLGVTNLTIGILNLIPGYPLDGALVVHAIAWWRSGTEAAATRLTVRLSRYVGWAFIGAGALMILISDTYVGLGMMVAGWLMTNSSRVLDQRDFLRALLNGSHVADALDSSPNRVPPQLTLDVFAAPYVEDMLGTAALVERGTELLGLVGTSQIRRIPRRVWGDTRTEKIMVPIGSVPVTSADADLWPALEVLERSGLDALVVPSDDGEPSLFTRRSAATLVHARAVAERRRLAALSERSGRGGLLGRGGFFGRRRP